MYKLCFDVKFYCHYIIQICIYKNVILFLIYRSYSHLPLNLINIVALFPYETGDAHMSGNLNSKILIHSQSIETKNIENIY